MLPSSGARSALWGEIRKKVRKKKLKGGREKKNIYMRRRRKEKKIKGKFRRKKYKGRGK